MADDRPILFGYWRSTAAYRVRIALAVKGIEAVHRPVDLRDGEQREPAHRARSAAGLVPVWQEPDGFTLTQSLAIIEYLDAMVPDPPLLPGDARQKAVIREIVLMIAADIHPLQNLRVLEALRVQFGADEAARTAWLRGWIEAGLGAVERRLAETAGHFAVGDTLTLADVVLVPQAYAARRFEVDLMRFPRVSAAVAAAAAVPAVAAAHPDRQADAAPPP